MSTEEKRAHLVLTADTKQYVAEVNAAAKADGAKADALKKQAASTGELGKKWEELSKSMVGLQLHDAFKRVSDGVREATNGVVDLNMAFAGYKVAGPWGAAVGAVGVAAFKAAEQFSLMNGKLGELVSEVEKKAGPEFTRLDGKLGDLTRTLYTQEAAILRQNAAWVELPRTMAYVFKAFDNVRDVLKDVNKDIKAYDESLRKTGLLMMVKGVEKAGGGARRSGGPSYDSVATGLGSQIAGGIGSYDYLQAMQDRADAASRLGTSNMIRSSADLGGYAGLQSQVDAFNSGEFGRRNAEAYGDFATGQQQSFLEKTFGPVDQFDLYAQGFQMLSGAVGSSLSAWIDGSASAGEAFKKFIGEALKGIAVQMAMESLKHGAYALGSLAFGDFRGAATHGKAALMFGTGAVLAAGAAKAFNGGGASVPSTGSAPNVSGGSGGSNTPERIIVYGDPFAEDSPRGRQRQAKRMVQRAMGNSSVETN